MNILQPCAYCTKAREIIGKAEEAMGDAHRNGTWGSDFTARLPIVECNHCVDGYVLTPQGETLVKLLKKHFTALPEKEIPF